VQPVIESIHLVGVTLLLGTIAIVDLRLLGLSLRHFRISAVAEAMAPWTSAGMVTVGITGPLLFAWDSSRYLKNPAFLVKMVLLAAALGAHFTIHRRVARDDARRVKLGAVLSLVLWSSVVLAGRAIADFDV
jgi:uncharacterized protein DUF6644